MATTKNIQAVERVFAILEFFRVSDSCEHSLKEISEALHLSKSTTFGLVNTMHNLGYLQQNPENQKYMLSIRLLNFSNTVQEQKSIIHLIHPYLEQISGQYGETIHCAMEYHNSLIYIDKVEAANSIYINSQIGTLNELHCTGVGKCILAYMDAKDQGRILCKGLRAMTENTITDPGQLQEELQKVREQGFAMDNEETALGLSCVAVPIFSGPDKVGCAISCSGVTSRIHTAIQHGLKEDLWRTAAEISRLAFDYEINPS